MKKYSNLIIVILSFIILILILLNKTIISKTIITSFSIWFNTLVPSMFPMFILSNILVSYNFTEYIPNKLVNVIAKFFNISTPAVLIIFLSMISGFPANAINITNAYNKKILSKEEAEHLLLFNHFANPLFILQTVGIFYLNNNKDGIIILISTILSNIIIAILFRKNNHPTCNYISKKDKCQNFGSVLSSAINSSINSLLMVSGSITLFLILSTLLTSIFNLNNNLEALIQGILEMTMSISSLSSLSISNTLKIIFITMIISFGGLSIHLQVYSSLDDKLSYKNYFLGRIYQTIFSALIAFLLINIL